MACLSGNSSGMTTTAIKTSSSDEADLQQVMMNDRKRKRMQSNRESARRSRMRKQKHLDDLTAEVEVLRRDNGQILNALQLTNQQFVNVEAENSVLRAQIAELATRLDSLNQILNCMDSYSGDGDGGGAAAPVDVGLIGNNWCVNQNQLIMASDYQVFGY